VSVNFVFGVCTISISSPGSPILTAQRNAHEPGDADPTSCATLVNIGAARQLEYSAHTPSGSSGGAYLYLLFSDDMMSSRPMDYTYH
jgi:hypothetical protein